MSVLLRKRKQQPINQTNKKNPQTLVPLVLISSLIMPRTHKEACKFCKCSRLDSHFIFFPVIYTYTKSKGRSKHSFIKIPKVGCQLWKLCKKNPKRAQSEQISCLAIVWVGSHCSKQRLNGNLPLDTCQNLQYMPQKEKGTRKYIQVPPPAYFVLLYDKE